LEAENQTTAIFVKQNSSAEQREHGMSAAFHFPELVFLAFAFLSAAFF
jgi:hypothetical protein